MSASSIRIEEIGLVFSGFRLCPPARLAAMERSLSASGQLQPVIVRRCGESYDLLDGFKRYHAARSLGWEELECRMVETDEPTAKVMILLYNVSGRLWACCKCGRYLAYGFLDILYRHARFELKF